MKPMTHLPPSDIPFAAFVAEEPFPFTRKLPLILTKMTPPRSSGGLLQRERLLQQLNSAENSSLTLVCAAAGFGKSTLLAQWYCHRQQQGDKLGWLTLEEDDNNPLLFMRYLLAALRPMYQGWSRGFTPYFGAELPPDLSLLLAELINQLHLCPYPLYLILDDYHCIQHPQIHSAISYLLQHAPEALHLIIGSRFRPALALSRLQVQDQLAEINDRDLRFTQAEASLYFTDMLSLRVKPQDIQRLLSLTDGWVAGMKMASLSPGWRYDSPAPKGGLSAGSRNIGRYLDEVIVAPLPAPVQAFLLSTAILNRLHPALCDAVTEAGNGAAMLAWIERHNLFLVALDETGDWFRTHPLLRDCLLKRLQQQGEMVISNLHERAGQWFARQQLWAEAIRHLLAAGKTDSPDAVVGAQSLAEEGDIDTLVRWMHYLPADLDASRVDLQLNLAWALSHHFRFADARQLLDNIDALVADDPEALARSSWVKLRVVRGICEAFAGNIALSIAMVEPLQREVPCGDIWVDGLICNILSYCHLLDQRPAQALDVQRRLPASNVVSRNLFVDVYRAFVVAQGYLRQGNVLQADAIASQALLQAERQIGDNSSSGATLAPILAEIAWEQGDISRLDALLTARLPRIDNFCPPENLSRCYILLARQAQLSGEHRDAENWLLQAEQRVVGRGGVRAFVPLLAERLAFAIQQDDPTATQLIYQQLQTLAQQAADEHNASNLVLINYYLHMSQCRLLLADNKPLVAAERLAQLVSEQEQRGEFLSALGLRVLHAVALWQADKHAAAVEIINALLPQVLAQKLQRSLLDSGPQLKPLLRQVRKTLTAQSALAALVTRLLLVGDDSSAAEPVIDGQHLTDREQQILQLIAIGHANKAIARHLAISVETVKWHLKQLYQKLQVSSRIQALNQARLWGVLE